MLYLYIKRHSRFLILTSFTLILMMKKIKINLEKLRSFSVAHDKSLDLQKFVRMNVDSLKIIYSNFITIDLDDFFCEDNKCLVGNEKASYYADENHLSIQGAKFLIDKFEKFLR